MSTAIAETDILKPRDPALDDNTDEWPEFVLSNVHVHLPGDQDAIITLLEASAGYPLTVTGQLEPLDDDDAHLYLQQPTKKRFSVVLEDVRTFSYGQYGDGSTAIWAAGKAGWYTLKPGRSYKPIYNSMVEAVNLLYFVADAYREPRKKGRGKNAPILPDYTAAEMFKKYAVEELGSSDPADGQAMIYQHKEFLIMCMLSGKEGMSWSKYPLTKHLKIKFPKIVAEVQRRLTTSVPQDEAPAKSKHAKSESARQVSVDTTASTVSKRQRGRKPLKPINVIEIDSDTEDSSAIQESLREAAARDRKTSASKESSPKYRSKRRQVYEEATEEATEEELATPVKDEETDEETRLRARKNKSSLRPRASKASKGAARKGGKGPPTGDNDEEDGETPSSPTDGGKRKYDDMTESRRPSKRRNSKTHVDEGIDIPTSPSTSGDAEDDSTNDLVGATSELPLRNLGHVPDPVQEDTWICALDGCAHKVYAASHPDSQRLIKAHYALHAYDDDERVQLVKKLQAPSLPAGHLMERIKQQAKQERFPGSRQMASRYPLTAPGNPVVMKY